MKPFFFFLFFSFVVLLVYSVRKNSCQESNLDVADEDLLNVHTCMSITNCFLHINLLFV